MSVPTFNAGGVNGLAALNFANSGMSSWLAANGNTVTELVGSPEVRTVQSAPPGGNWEMVRTLGLGPRRVIWNVRLLSAISGSGSEVNLNNVEAAIEAYLGDGGAYAFADSKGRTTDFAILLADGTGLVGPRLTTPTGNKLQHWRLAFSVLWPQVGNAGKL
jgi:hypothetical protein